MRRAIVILLLPGFLSLSGLNLWLIEGADLVHRMFHEWSQNGSLDRAWDGSHRCDQDEGFAVAKKMEKKTASLLLKEKKNPSDQAESPFLFSSMTLLLRVSLGVSAKAVFLRTDPLTPPPDFIS